MHHTHVMSVMSVCATALTCLPIARVMSSSYRDYERLQSRVWELALLLSGLVARCHVELCNGCQPCGAKRSHRLDGICDRLW